MCWSCRSRCTKQALWREQLHQMLFFHVFCNSSPNWKSTAKDKHYDNGMNLTSKYLLNYEVKCSSGYNFNFLSIIKWLTDAFGKFCLIAAASTYVRHVLNLCVSPFWRTERRRQWCLVGFPTVPCCGRASSVSSHWWRPLTQTTPTCAATGRGQSLPPPHLWI